MIVIEVRLVIDGKSIHLNEFVKEFLAGTLTGAIAPLDGVNKTWKEMDIRIKR